MSEQEHAETQARTTKATPSTARAGSEPIKTLSEALAEAGVTEPDMRFSDEDRYLRVVRRPGPNGTIVSDYYLNTARIKQELKTSFLVMAGLLAEHNFSWISKAYMVTKPYLGKVLGLLTMAGMHLLEKAQAYAGKVLILLPL